MERKEILVRYGIPGIIVGIVGSIVIKELFIGMGIEDASLWGKMFIPIPFIGFTLPQILLGEAERKGD